MNRRIPEQRGEVIDRGRVVSFEFEGKTLEGFEGDTISSALSANGVRIVGRSFKYHRPRGLFSLADADCNALFEAEGETNIRGDRTAITEGMRLCAVNTIGGVAKDRLGILNRFSAFTPVGFYYKAFHTPRRLFPFYEKRIREMAGLGRVNTEKRTPATPKDYAFCDILVVGAGPAGLSAALAAAESGAKVLLVDENPWAGGSLAYLHKADGRLDGLLTNVRSTENIELRLGCLAAGHYADHWVALADNTRLTKVRAGAVIVAAGCYEQPAVFRNNDLPGVMLATGALRLLRLYAVKPFEKVVVMTANPEGYSAAVAFHEAGIAVRAIVDLRPEGESSRVGHEVADLGITVHPGSVVHEALASKGSSGISGAVVREWDGDGSVRDGKGVVFDCDGLAMSVGWAGADGLLRQPGGRMVYARELEQFVPEELPAGVFAAGRVNGIFDLERKLDDGRCAGEEAARYVGRVGGGSPNGRRPVRERETFSHPYPMVPHPKGKNFIDLDEDVTLVDIENACREGFDNPELLKRYTTVGMGPSQGKLSNLPALRVLNRMRGESMEDKQLTTARPFSSAVKLSHLAGRTFTAYRRTPVHSFHEAAGAKFMHAGNWLRPEYYEISDLSRDACIFEEAKNVRLKVGIIDLSTLGKIEVTGPDTVEFLNRIYTGRFDEVKVGMTRYGLMCDESGVVVDDGIIGRLADEVFNLTTTTSGSDAIYRSMTRSIMEWGLDVAVTNLTSHFLAMNIAGPLARDVLQPVTDIDLSEEAFPYLAFRVGAVAGVPARVSRAGFVSKLGYEIHLPADGGMHAWKTILEAGKTSGIRPFGVEAQRLLRLEMGHLIVGQDTDGLTQPYEIGLSWAVKMAKPFFVGQRSLEILKKRDLDRTLAGFSISGEYTGPLPKECNLVVDAGEITGRVTSIGLSPAVGHPIGMVYVHPSQAEVGTRIKIRLDDGSAIEATVARLPFYDPENNPLTKFEE